MRNPVPHALMQAFLTHMDTARDALSDAPDGAFFCAMEAEAATFLDQHGLDADLGNDAMHQYFRKVGS